MYIVILHIIVFYLTLMLSIVGFICRRWDDLESFLSRYDNTTTSTTTNTTTSSSYNRNILTSLPSSTKRLLSMPMIDHDRFQLSVGKLLLCLHRQDRTGFECELERAQRQVGEEWVLLGYVWFLLG